MRNLIITGTLAASLAFGANAAMAAPPQAHKPATALQVTHAQTAQAPAYGGWQGARYAAGGYLPRNQLGLDVSQFIQGMLGGGPVPYANRDARLGRRLLRLFVAELRQLGADRDWQRRPGGV